MQNVLPNNLVLTSNSGGPGDEDEANSMAGTATVSCKLFYIL